MLLSTRAAVGAFVVLMTAALSAQQTDRQLLESIRKLLEEHLVIPPDPVADPTLLLHVPCGKPIQPVLDTAKPLARVELDPGCAYPGSITLRGVTLATRDWSKPGDGWLGTVTPADTPRLATIVPTPREAFGIDIPNGTNAGGVTLEGLAVAPCAPAGACDQIRIGSAGALEADPDNMVDGVTLRQVVVSGDPTFGGKRGIAVNGRDVQIVQSWCAEQFLAAQDSQCIAGTTGQGVTVRFTYLAAASENLLVGGDRVANAAMAPRDWVIEDNILHKPRRWRPTLEGGDGRDRDVKNLFELKHGSGFIVRRNLMVGNWKHAQDGTAILFHYTPQYKCPPCIGLSDILFAENVVLDITAGISFQGYTFLAEHENGQKLQRVTVEGNYFSFDNTGRMLQMGNVLGEHDITVRRNSFRNSGTTWFVGAYGKAWTDGVLVAGGPISGLRLIGNLVARNGTYGITAPSSVHYGTGIGTFVSSGLEISGNVLGDAPASHVTNYNKHVGPGTPNVSAPRAGIVEALTRDSCGSYGNAGADCAKLADVFARLKYLPEP